MSSDASERAIINTLGLLTVPYLPGRDGIDQNSLEDRVTLEEMNDSLNNTEQWMFLALYVTLTRETLCLYLLRSRQ